MRRHVLQLIIAAVTFLVGFYVSDFGQCNRPFGPRCCLAERPLDFKVAIFYRGVSDGGINRKK